MGFSNGSSPPASSSSINTNSTQHPVSRNAATNRKGQVMGVLAVVGCLLIFQYQIAEHRMNMEQMTIELEMLHGKNHKLQQKLQKLLDTEDSSQQKTKKASLQDDNIQSLQAELQAAKQTAMTQQQETQTSLTQHQKLMEDLTRQIHTLQTAKNPEIQSLRTELQTLQAHQKKYSTYAASSISKNQIATMLSLPSPQELANRPQFPATKFTPHVRELLEVIDNVTLHLPDDAADPWAFDPHKYCALGYHIFVDQPYTPPTVIECNPDNAWCLYFRHLFQNASRVLPYNVSIGESQGDMVRSKTAMGWGQCFASSGPDQGGFSMNNFQDVKEQMEKADEHDGISYKHVHNITWEKRHRIPVFRGHPRMPEKPVWKANPGRCEKETLQSGKFGERARAVLFSLKYPKLLNARVKYSWHPCQIYNATNGMDQLFGWGPKYHRDEDIQIPSSSYYTEYQVVVVLGGIGAAFRTPKHLSAGQAIVLQRFKYEEWFYKYMTPYVHYIPLKENLSDLKEVMEWVRDNPQKVQQIAENGKKFYHEYLSFPKNDEHWYELIWRLAELIHDKGPERLKTGTVRTIWPAPIVPWRFLRDPTTGVFVEEERSKTRQPYLDADKITGEFTKP
ncbi:KDEL motif-containing protein 2 [Seminavis robusta]|uniref:KDEL motif-containing protein 2 n=1 Tax=Seminavis robusta TaxID=568900 RepID=A0A9N8END1_9STRA|nr:KDEL motif-containing protein 2 [Seminavis robusta]|eukprot:Sro1616_g286260.1 KDEL motif-containing protein 2 (619) ;mRNA; r:19234-21090